MLKAFYWLLLLLFTGVSYAQELSPADAQAAENTLQKIEALSPFHPDSALTLHQAFNLQLEKKHGRNNKVYQQSMAALGTRWFYKSEYKKAIAALEEAITWSEKNDRTGDPAFLPHLRVYLNAVLMLQDYKKASGLLNLLVQRSKQQFGTQYPEYAWDIEWQASFLYNSNHCREAIPLLKEALAIRLQKQGEASVEYLTTLGSLKNTYSCLKDYEEAARIGKTESLVKKNMYGSAHETYLESLESLGHIYFDMGNFAEAGKMYEDVYNIIKTKAAPGRRLAEVTYQVASFYQHSNQLNLAQERADEARQHYLGLTDTLHNGYSKVLQLQAWLAAKRGDYIPANNYMQTALRIDEKTTGKQSTVYARTMFTAGLVNDHAGNYNLAENYYKSAAAIFKTQGQSQQVEYAGVLESLAGVYQTLQNTAAAEKHYLQAYDIFKLRYVNGHPRIVSALLNIGGMYSVSNRYEMAEQYLQQALEMSKAFLQEDDPVALSALNNLADLYNRKKLYSKALPLHQRALMLRTTSLGKHHPETLISLNNLGVTHRFLKNYDSAAKIFEVALKGIAATQGPRSTAYAQTLVNMAANFYASRNYAALKPAMLKAVAAFTQNHQALINGFSEAEKEMYLQANTVVQNFFLSVCSNLNNPETDLFFRNSSSLQGSLLLGKYSLKKAGAQATDPELALLFRQWQQSTAQYARAIQEPGKNSALSTSYLDSLEAAALTQEKQIIARFPALKEELFNTAFTTEEIRKRLQPGEVILHWVNFKYKSPDQPTDTVKYAAFVLRKDDVRPLFINVFEERQLQVLLTRYHNSQGRGNEKLSTRKLVAIDSELYQLIWKPLLPYLKDAERIIHVPAGLLHKISFAALHDSTNNTRLIDKINLRQYLSLQDWMNSGTSKNAHRTIALLGGIDYGKNTKGPGAGFQYLPGTQEEIDAIALIAQQLQWSTKSYNKNTVDMRLLNSMSEGSSPAILHIATHGYYKPSSIQDSTNEAGLHTLRHDFPMLRSGLVLSRANESVQDTNLQEGLDDGIATAQELSNLNLFNTQLVVLSACETALGDINSSEGVYGLQRAFRMAGARCLLVSLWEVPDKETAELMVLFYKNVFAGNSYQESLKSAQLTLKEKYKDPALWAGFVLIGE